MNRGLALRSLGRLAEAVTAYDESIGILREQVEQEHRQDLRNDLARAFYNLALVREKLKAMPAALDAVRETRRLRSEERRVGKECRARWGRQRDKERSG